VDGRPLLIRDTDLRPVEQARGISGSAAVDASLGATRIFFGAGTTAPRSRSAAHHHGDTETVAYVVSGRMRVYFGERFEEWIEAGPGDIVYIPPFLPHVEENPGDEPFHGLVARAPGNVVVTLEDGHREAPPTPPAGRRPRRATSR